MTIGSLRHRTGALGGLLLASSLLLAGTLVGADALGLRFNLSPSLPIGLYRRVDQPIRRRALVITCPPEPAAWLALARGYLDPGACPGGTEPLGKIVLALGGDVVDIQDDGLTVNGWHVPRSRLAAVDSHGRPLPRLDRRRLKLGLDEVFLFSPFDPRSFDSRYFGPVPRTAVVGTIAPILVWSPTAPPGFRLERFRAYAS